ncbi:MAG: penicillin-binding transpeptidase domain-containing protein [Patescibacteria group bacterium]
MKLGQAFSDSVITEQKTATRFGKPKAPSWWLGAGRALLFTTTLFVALFILGWRLFDLTVIHGYEFRGLSDGNRTRELIRHAPRGRILDRTGRELARNDPIYRLILPCTSETQDPCIEILSAPERDAALAKGLPPGAYIENDFTRVYPAGAATSHVIGYIGEITQKELGDNYYQLRGYKAGDRLGRMGAEAVFEERLRGRNGRELVEINAAGIATRTLGRIEEVPGEDVTLTIDRGVAEAATAAFPPDKKGAIVVAQPMTGEILALYTSPTFDANIFSTALSPEAVSGLFENPDLPMFNRGIGGVYPPGSIFKLITAIAGLEEGTLTADTLIEDTGEVVIGPFKFANWYFTQYGKTEGLVNIVKALQRSNDIFFYKAGEAIGITKLSLWAKRLGVGAPLGIQIPGEAAGLMPNPSWKALRFDSAEDKRARNDLWYLGDTYHVSIGQGYLLTTPLQANTWTNAVANGGKLCRPTIEKLPATSYQLPAHCKNLNIKKETIDLITEGMKRACEPGGTGWPLFNFNIKYQIANSKYLDNGTSEASSSSLTASKFIPLACKTGTAEYGDPDDKTHAWFTAFAPIPERFAHGTGQAPLSNQSTITGEPEISVTVLVEGAGEGSDNAAPVAKKILEEWFGR